MARAITGGFLPRVYIVAMRSLWCIAALLSVHFVVSSVASGADQQWPQFRGPSAGVAADDPSLPDSWSATENIAWKADVPGIGWSSPIVWGDHVFVTSVVNTGTGEPPKPGLYFGGERPTPTTPHKWMVYDIDFNTGRIRWARCAGASPVLHQDRIYIVNDNDDQSFLAAFNKRTGEEIWRVNRAEGTNWATPFVWQNAQRTELVTSGTDRVLVRSVGHAAVGTERHVVDLDSDAFRAPRAAVHQFRLRRRSAAAAYAIKPGRRATSR